jgi:5-methylcytosine-specific restriction enzyme subunit McrC
VRGRIEHLSTARRQLLAQGRIACRFEELTVDSPRNRFVRSALHSVAQLVRKPELAHRCRGLALPAEEAGPNAVLDPQRCVRWLRTLYERAIGGFFRLHLDQTHWRVRTGKPLTWWMEDASSGIAAVFPSMRTDIVIDRHDPPQRLVIDTKFTGVYRRGWHREQTLRSGYV